MKKGSLLQKKTVAVCCAGIAAVTLGTAAASCGKVSATDGQDGEDQAAVVSQDTERIEHEQERAGAVKPKEELLLWYSDESYKTYFEQAAADYYADTGVLVEPVYQDTLDPLGEIYDATMQDTTFPDLYLLGSDQLEAAYLYGLAAENTAPDIYAESTAKNAVAAATYHGAMYAYPLSYETCLFAYWNGYFETAPASIQSIIDYSNDNEQPEDVQYLLEWNVGDAFYDFPFVSNSVSFVKENAETMQIQYDETLYAQDLEFFATILKSFSIDTDTVTEESVVSDFNEKKTLCAILSSDSVLALDDGDYSVTAVLPLNDTLSACSAAFTDLVVVNDFSEKKEAAADFAEYVTLTMAEEMSALGGHYPVKLSEDADEKEQTAYAAYEASVLAPDSQDAEEFWVSLKETIQSQFE